MNDNKNAIKRVTPCKFLCQIIFCNVEFAQDCRKFEFSGGKIEFHGKKSSFAIFGQNEFPSKRTKKACYDYNLSFGGTTSDYMKATQSQKLPSTALDQYVINFLRQL